MQKNMGEDGIGDEHDKRKRFTDNLRTADIRNIPGPMDFPTSSVLTGNHRR